MDIMRPQTSLGFSGTNPDHLTDPRVKFGEDVLHSGLKDHLQNFYHKATPEDRRRCLDLINSIERGEHIKDQAEYLPESYPKSFERSRPKRPKTAMAAIDRPHDPMYPYMTTYKREYMAHPGPPAPADRPGTSRHQAAHDLSAPLGSSTYHNEYYSKNSRAQPVRTGSSSGNRRNNPHPPESFMVWKFPRNIKKERAYSEWSTQLTDDVLDKVMRGQLASTYQQDYLGIPQGYQVKSAFTEKEDWKTRVPYTLDSSTRYTFQKPDQQPELKGNTYRYGCNKQKQIPALGVVPTVSKRPHMHIQPRTTYEREYNETGTPDIKDYGKYLGAKSLEKYLAGAGYKDEESIRRMINTMNPHPPSSSHGSRSSSSYRARPSVPPATCLESPTLVY